MTAASRMLQQCTNIAKGRRQSDFQAKPVSCATLSFDRPTVALPLCRSLIHAEVPVLSGASDRGVARDDLK